MSIASSDSFANSGFCNAANAPNCAKVVALEVVWLWRLETALAMSSGAVSVPKRQPVMEYALLKPETKMVWFCASAEIDAGLTD